MKYHYEHATRWFRWTSNDDVRGHRPPANWEANAMQLDCHPITSKAFKQSQWWVCEKYVGGR